MRDHRNSWLDTLQIFFQIFNLILFSGKRYELLFNTLTAFDEANVLGQQGRVLKLNKYLDLLSENLDKLANEAPFDPEAILNKEGKNSFETVNLFKSLILMIF